MNMKKVIDIINNNTVGTFVKLRYGGCIFHFCPTNDRKIAVTLQMKKVIDISWLSAFTFFMLLTLSSCLEAGLDELELIILL